MIIDTFRMTAPQDKRLDILQTISMISGSVRKERGCRGCDVFIDTENADAFLLMKE